MTKMFNDCTMLKEIHIPNIDTSGVTSMSYLFANCPELEVIEVGEGFNTANVTSFDYMFYRSPKALSEILGKIDASSVTSMSYMFYDCSLTQTQFDFIKS